MDFTVASPVNPTKLYPNGRGIWRIDVGIKLNAWSDSSLPSWCNTYGEHVYGDFYAYTNKNYAPFFKTTFVGQGPDPNRNANLMENMGNPPNFVYDTFYDLDEIYTGCEMMHTCYASDKNVAAV